MKRYNPSEIEAKWQKYWSDNQAYIVDDNDPRPKFYHLVEFPYPSGAGLHVGHCRSYITFDIMSRWRRMCGENVLFPMGWDSFGLPAEQYALKTGVHPSKTTETNINTFRQQAQSLGLSFDWSREFSTSDPKIYKWTQWIFLNLYKHGLAYQAESMVWWCEELKSVLADEEVINGRSERGDFVCERRPLRQWMLKITQYADRLYDDLDDVDYIEPVKVQQRNWIGRSKGAEVDFLIDGDKEKITVFTTRPDTLYGATYLVLAPEHPLVNKLTSTDQQKSVSDYVRSTASKSELTRQEDVKEKTGVFTGAFAINPINNQKVPIWIADYVLMGYGTGAIMAVPAHDERDYEFAQKFNLPILPVVEPVAGEKQGDEVTKDAIIAVVRNPKTNQVLMLDWGPRRQGRWGGQLFIGGGQDEGEDEVTCARREVAEETGYINLKYVSSLPYYVHNYYFSNVKNKNYYARIRGVLFDLEDDTQIPVKLDKSEEGLFTPKWVDISSAAQLVEDEAHLRVFEGLINDSCYVGEGLMVNSDKYNGQASSSARDKMVSDLASQKLAKEVTNYKLRDWVFSRQRYWGEPFPIVWVKQDQANSMSGEVANWLPEDAVIKEIDGVEYAALPIPPNYLPVVLPNVADFTPKGLGKGPLAEAEDWVHVWYDLNSGETKEHGGDKPDGDTWVEGLRETDTMPNWAGSSWYFLRYLDHNNDQELASLDKINTWMPVNWYNGGMEHTTLHLLYSRFWHKFLFDIGVVNTVEPYAKRTSHGTVLALDGRKMSKSWGNVVDPMDIVVDYGADTLRLYTAFIGPFDQSVAWNVNGVAGCRRFIERFWTIAQEFLETKPTKPDQIHINDKNLRSLLAETNMRISRDIPRLGFNTSVAALMEAVNKLYKIKETLPFKDNTADWYLTFQEMIIFLAPFTPHLAEDLWEQFGFEGEVLSHMWPKWDEEALKSDTKIIVIQINGKLRGQISVSSDATESVILEQSKAQPKVAEILKEKEVVKSIYVLDKLVNFVIK